MRDVLVLKDLARFSAVALLTLGFVSPVAVSAQTATAASLEEWIRTGYEFSWERGRPMRDEVRQVWSQLGSGGVGYGFRTFRAREGAPDSIPSMEYWRVTLDELHTSVVGDVGLAWGVHTEEFKVVGEPPEIVRVRFTNTLRWNGQRWENLLYHRDAQAFGEDGRASAAQSTLGGRVVDVPRARPVVGGRVPTGKPHLSSRSPNCGMGSLDCRFAELRSSAGSASRGGIRRR